MFPSAHALLVGFGHATAFFKRRPRTTIVLAALLCLVLGWVVVDLWAAYHLRSAERAWQEDRLEDARQHLDLCLRFRPFQGHLLGARIERLVANYPAAEKHLRECKDIAGMTERLQLEWVLLRALQGESGLEPAMWEQIKDKSPYAPLILETLGVCYLRDFRYQHASYCLGKLLEIEPDHLRALDWRSWIWENQDRKTEAGEDCRRALALCPRLWKTRVRLASVLLTEKVLQEADEQVQILRQTRPDAGEVRLIYARLQMLQGKFDEAKQTLDELLAEDPKTPAVLFFRGRVEQDPVKAENYFRRTLAVDPFYNEAWYNLYLALCMQAKERTPEAMQAKARHEKNEKDFRRLKQIFQKFEESPNSALLAQIGQLYLELGIPANARKFSLRVLELDPANRKAHEVLEALKERDAGASRGDSK